MDDLHIAFNLGAEHHRLGVLHNLAQQERRRRLPYEWKDIAREVAERHKLRLDHLIGDRRFKAIVLARQEAMFEIRRDTGMSYPRLGQLFGGRDHTTALHACRAHADRNGLARLDVR